jgi:drug/metabolite transporter (DMT)-like permease
LGPVTAAASTYVVSGIIAVIILLVRGAPVHIIRSLPRKYLFGCGVLFLAYTLVLFLGLGWASNHQQVLEVGLLNYLWPALILLFSIPVLGKKLHWLLFPGTLLALTGLFLVLTQGESVTFEAFVGHIQSNPAAYTMGLLAAVFWALYSTLTARYARGREGGGVLLFLPITGLTLTILALFMHEEHSWTVQTILEVLFLGSATYLGYSLWDTAMRLGNVTLVGAASYLTPLFATLFAAIYLGAPPESTLWIGCLLLIVGSAISGRALSVGNEKSPT